MKMKLKSIIFKKDHLGVSKNRGETPKMDGLFHGKPYYFNG